MKDWMKLLALGLISLVFGVVVFAAPVMASIAVTTVVSVLLLFIGALQVYGGITTGDSTFQKLMNVLLGVLLLFLGVSFLAHPLEGVISLAMLVVVLLASTGVIRIVLSYRMRATTFFWPMLVSGVISVLLAGYILVNFAAASLVILGIILGVELLTNGIGLIMLAFFTRAHAPRVPDGK